MNIINIEHISKLFGDKLIFDDASFGLQEGDKVGIVGINGTGKSTLLRMAAGEETPDSGQIIRQNNLKMAYLPQTPEFPKDATVLSYALSGDEEEWQVQSNLVQLGITEYDAKLDTLSGGQRRKVALAKVLASDFDVLILGEPTNHLDNAMLSWLENYLKNYRGTVFMVTHDRYFLDRTVNRIFSFEGNGVIRQFEGGYSDYLIRKELEGLDTEVSLKGHAAATEEQSTKGESSSKDTWKQRKSKLKFTYKEQREFETIDDDIAKLEEKIETLDAQIAANATNSVKLRELMEKKEETENALDEKMDRWVYLNDLNEKIQDAKQQG